MAWDVKWLRGIAGPSRAGNLLLCMGLFSRFFVLMPQPIAQGTLKKPRNRTRPPLTGCPLTA
ncbi:hypothetical protein ACVWZV_007857 [Bradyrhizobium sp. GM5.1]